jgi:hypothetical protein
LCSAPLDRKIIYGAEPPKLGETKEINVEEEKSFGLGGRKVWVYECKVAVRQGDRLRIFVEPVADAEINTEIHVFLDGKVGPIRPPKPGVDRELPFEFSGMKKRQEFSMKKRLPGGDVVVRLISDTPGKLKFRVSTANGERTEKEIQSLIKLRKEEIAELEKELEALKKGNESGKQ